MSTDSIGIFNDLIMRGGLVQNKNQLRLFKNIRFSMYPARAFAIALNRMNKDKGQDYIKELGRIMGENSASDFKKEISKLKSLIKKNYQTIPNLIEISGFGKIDFYKEDDDKTIIQIKDHPVIKPAKDLYKENNFICSFYGEIYASYIKVFNNLKSLNINHTKCICKGDELCEWIMAK